MVVAQLVHHRYVLADICAVVNLDGSPCCVCPSDLLSYVAAVRVVCLQDVLMEASGLAAEPLAALVA